MTTVVPETRSHIGRSQPRRDAREKLRGEAQFVGDLLVPRMLHGKVLRSPIAHGRIVSIDTSAAARLPGVVCVLTGADLHDIDPYYGHSIKDRPILAIDKEGDVVNCGLCEYEFEPDDAKACVPRLVQYNFAAPLIAEAAPVTSAPDKMMAAR